MTAHADYTRRRRLLRAVWIAALPAVLLMIALGARPASWAIGMAWIVALIVVDQHFEAWPCPRCGKAFFRKGAWHNSFARRCLNCDFPRPAKADLAGDSARPAA